MKVIACIMFMYFLNRSIHVGSPGIESNRKVAAAPNFLSTPGIDGFRCGLVGSKVRHRNQFAEIRLFWSILRVSRRNSVRFTPPENFSTTAIYFGRPSRDSTTSPAKLDSQSAICSPNPPPQISPSNSNKLDMIDLCTFRSGNPQKSTATGKQYLRQYRLLTK